MIDWENRLAKLESTDRKIKNAWKIVKWNEKDKKIMYKER